MQKRRPIYRPLILAVCAAHLLAHAAKGQHFSFQSFTEDQGLSNLNVSSLLQDRTGFLWIGTQNGVFRFDGHQFTAFHGKQGLTDNMTYAIHQTPDGVIWIASMKKLFRFEKDHLTETDDKADGAMISWDVRSPFGLASEPEGRLFVATSKGLVVGDLTKPDSTERRFHYFTHPGLEPGQAVQAVHVDPGGIVWFSSLNRLHGWQGGRLITLGEEAGLPLHAWTSIMTDAAGNLWVRGESHLYVRKRGAGKFIAQEKGLPKETRAFLSDDGKGGVLVTSAQGLGHWTGTEWRFYDDSNGLPGQSVCCSLRDREGSRWVGLRGAGLVRWRNPDEWESYARGEGLRSEEVWSIERDRIGQVWAATSAGVELLLPAGQKARFGDSLVTALSMADDGAIWAAMYPGGVMRIDPKARTAKRFGKESGIANERVLSVFADRSSKIWVGTMSGLFVAPTATANSRFSRVTDLPGSETEMFHQAAQDSRGAVWVAGGKGLAKLEGDRWTRFAQKDGLLGDHVAGVTVTGADDIWVYYGDRGGVSRLRMRNGGGLKTDHFRGKDEVHSGQPTFVGADHRGGIWVGGDQGVDLFNGTSWRYFSRAQGLVWNDCNSNSFFADVDGGVWIGTSKGAAHYRPPDRVQPKPAPPIILNSARWGAHDLINAEMASFDYEKTDLEVSFAALTFTNEAGVRYSYRLLGQDAGWVEKKEERSARYPSLPPGAYTFEVLGRSAEEVWSLAPARFSFQINPPFWRTWWFGLVIAAMVAIGAWRTWLWRMRSLLERQIELERLIDERTSELQKEKADLLKARAELQELATRDSLTGLWNRRMIFEILNKELDRARKEGHAVSVVMADLDGFKKINDQHGHAVGDMVLKHAASLFQAAVRSTDSVGRYGGEELLIVLTDCSGAAAAARAEELRRALASHPLEVPNGTLTVTSSFGVNWTNGVDFDGPALVKDADEALYRAKKGGRNRVETAESQYSSEPAAVPV